MFVEIILRETKRDLQVLKARDLHNIPIPKQLNAEKRRAMQKVEQ